MMAYLLGMVVSLSLGYKVFSMLKKAFYEQMGLIF